MSKAHIFIAVENFEGLTEGVKAFGSLAQAEAYRNAMMKQDARYIVTVHNVVIEQEKTVTEALEDGEVIKADDLSTMRELLSP